MTPDHFWSAAYIRSLSSDSDFRKDLLSDVARFIRMSLDKHDDDGNDIPIFTFIKEYVKDFRESRQFGRVNRSQVGQSQRNYRELTENAAVADSTPTGKLFDSEVPLSQGIKAKDNVGREQKYVAMKKKSSICPKCYPESGPATEKCR